MATSEVKVNEDLVSNGLKDLSIRDIPSLNLDIAPCFTFTADNLKVDKEHKGFQNHRVLGYFLTGEEMPSSSPEPMVSQSDSISTLN